VLGRMKNVIAHMVSKPVTKDESVKFLLGATVAFEGRFLIPDIGKVAMTDKEWVGLGQHIWELLTEIPLVEEE
jgi:hypothetical protein